MDKRQVVVIHGGETFASREDYISWLRAEEFALEGQGVVRWKGRLQDELGEWYEVIQPRMPNSFNATYEEWEIWFEKYLPQLSQDLILVGHSLGGIFLAKYLAEKEVGKNILGTFLVAPPFDSADSEYSLADFVLPDSLDLFATQSRVIHIYFSTDDPTVPFADLAKYQAKLPNARVSVFSDRGHFKQESFPELVEEIRLLG